MLEIYDDERLIGRLSVFDNARKGVCYEFSYDESFLKSENAFVIDKNLALNAQIHKSTALWDCFKDCARQMGKSRAKKAIWQCFE